MGLVLQMKLIGLLVNGKEREVAVNLHMDGSCRVERLGVSCIGQVGCQDCQDWDNIFMMCFS